MLTLNDGRNELWQWDTGRKLTVDADCSQVHLSNKVFGRSIDVDVVDGIAVIPDILLQTDKDLTAWAFAGTAENGYTKISKVFKVNKRNKPADYVFTPTDQTTLGDILDRIEDLENRPSGDVSEEDIQNAVNDYLDKNPISVEEKDPTVPDWAKQPEKPKYTAVEVGALPADTPIPEGVTDEQIQNAVGAYLEENPPSGGGGWKLVANVTLSDDVEMVEIANDIDGNPIATHGFSEMFVFYKLLGKSGYSSRYSDLDIRFIPYWAGGYGWTITGAANGYDEIAGQIYAICPQKQDDADLPRYGLAFVNAGKSIGRFNTTGNGLTAVYAKSTAGFVAGSQIIVYGR